MNCRDIESLILAERDGVLTSAQHAVLSAHVAACPACEQLRANLGEAATFLKTDAANVAVPDADKEWRTIRARLHGEPARPARKRRLAPVIWFSAPFAAAAALIIGFLLSHSEPPQPAPVQMAGHIDAGEAGVSTIAYVDKDSGWLVVWATDPAAKSSG